MMTSHAQHYTVAGWMPGYLPTDDDPRALDFTSALGCLADELRQSADHMYERCSDCIADPDSPQMYSQDEQSQLEAEGDRVHSIAQAIEAAATELERTEGAHPASITLEGEPYPVSMIRASGLSVHIETEPDSLHHLGWIIGLEPVPEGVAVCDDCGSMWEAPSAAYPSVPEGECPECSRL